MGQADAGYRQYKRRIEDAERRERQDREPETERTQTELIAGELCELVEFPPDCSPKEAAMVVDVASRAADELIRLELRLNEATNTVRRLADEGITRPTKAGQAAIVWAAS